MILRYVCRSAFVFCRFTVTMEKSRDELHQHVLCGLFNVAISWWKGRVVVVALELLWGLKIIGCWAIWLVFSSLAHFSLGCLCSQTVTQLCSFEIKFLCRPLWRLTMDHIIKKKKKGKSKKKDKKVFPCTEVSFLYSSERLLRSGYYIVFTFKPWWITRSLISLIYEIVHFLWIPGCNLASLMCQEG